MNYQSHYNKLIERAKRRCIDGYTERHHVIPKCLGGSNNNENLVRLTAREHFVAHQLLVKIYPSNNNLIFAAIAMTIDYHGNRVNNRMYGWLKSKMAIAKRKENLPSETLEKMSKAKKGNQYWLGKHHTDESKQKISKANSGNQYWLGKHHTDESKQKISTFMKSRGIGEKNNFYGKHHSEETKAKLREKRKLYVPTEETRLKLKLANVGRIHSETTRMKISNAKKGIAKPKNNVCPYCKKVGDAGNMARWHFENCKNK